MNERIRELTEQAGFFPELNYEHTGWHAAGHNDLFEKFAELIVKECARVVEDAVDHREPASTYVAKIKQHFGVET